MLQCIKHKTSSAVILNRFETLNRVLLLKMAGATALDIAPPVLPEGGAVASEVLAAPQATGEQKKKKKQKKK